MLIRIPIPVIVISPSENDMRTLCAPAVRAVIAALLACGASTLAGVPTKAAQPQYSLEERAVAIARPSLVLMENQFTGFLRNKATGQPYTPQPVVFFLRCSGFVINPDGYALTATNCVQPTETSQLNTAVNTLATSLVTTGKMPNTQKAAYVADLMANAAFTGESPGSKPANKLQAQPNSVRSGEASIAASVVATTPVAQSNVALVKLVLGGLPAVEVGQAELSIGTALSVIGYRGVDLGGGQGMFVPANRVSKVSRLPGNEPRPIELDSELGTYSYGGMAVDSSGKVAGLVNIDQKADNQPRRVLIPSSQLSDLLTRGSVTGKLSRVDITYREALDAYLGGRYSESITKFDAVLAAVPDHELATSYRKQAQDRRAVEGDRVEDEGLTLRTAILVGAATAGVLVILFLVIFFLVRRSRKRQREAQQQQYIGMYSPLSPGPVSGPGYYAFNEYLQTEQPPTGYAQTLPAPISIPPADTAPQHPHRPHEQQQNPWDRPPGQ
jgi:hypothetical protein